MNAIQGDLFGGDAAEGKPVYVDALFQMESRNHAARMVGERTGHQWCHMWSDDLDALHALAAKIGLKREWFQNNGRLPHYDLTPNKRAAALKAGAREMCLREYLRRKYDGRSSQVVER